MLSRTKPNIPVEDLSLKGMATLLDQNALAFTENEAMQLFRLNADDERTGSPATEVDQAARAAWRFSQGWTAALWLGVQNWRKRGSFGRPADIETLLEENLKTSFTQEERNLQMRLSLLDGFSAEDVRLLTDTLNVDEKISRLQAKAALIHFDPATRRYFQHDLARQFLSKKLLLSDILTPDLYRRAAECFIRRNELTQAAPLLAKAGRDEDMLRLLDVVFMPDGSMPLFYFTKEVVDAILSIPWRLRLKRPLEYTSFLSYYLAEAGNAVHRHLLDDALDHIHDASNLTEAQKEGLLSELRRIGHFLDSEESPATAEKGLGNLAVLWKGSFAARPHWNWAFGCPHAGYLYLRKPGEYARISGLIGSSIWAYQDMTDGGVAGSRALFAAERHLELGEFAKAEPLLRAAVVQAGEFDMPAVRLCAGFCQARLCIARGQAEAALSAIDTLQDEVERLGHANYDRCLDLARCHIQASLGNLAGISGWLKEEHLAPNQIIILMKGYLHSLQGKAMLLAGKYDSLGALAASLPTGQGAYNNLFGRIHGKVLEALAAWFSNRPDQAHEFFREALALARPDGIVLSIAEYGANILPLLASFSASEKDDEYLRKLLRLAKNIASASTSGARAAVLTPRQEEFLRLAMQGKSNDEIARHAGVKITTVKKTLGSAYQRLGVKNRAEAIRLFMKTEHT